MCFRLVFAAAFVLAAGVPSSAQPLDPALYAPLKWRCIGPFRARAHQSARRASPGQPNVFYIGVNNGGVWKTTDYGRTWKPIFDDQPTGSIGAIAVAPSNPDIIYVGSGEGLQRPDLSTGDGIYKSTDGGKTWTHLGLRDGAADPADRRRPARIPNRLFVAVLGHPYGANAERGVFRSTDGGADFQKVLYKDENTGGDRRRVRPDEPGHRLRRALGGAAGPWENGACQRAGQRALQVDRRRHHLAAADGGLADVRRRAGPHRHRRRAERPEAPLRRSSMPPRPAASTAPTTRARAGGGSTTTRGSGPRRRLRRGQGRPEEPRHRLRRQHRRLEVDRRRQDVHRASAARPAATTTTASGSTRDNPTIMLLAADQGAVITVNGGETLELLVQPADRAALPRHRPTTASRIASAAASRRAARPASPAAATTAQITFRDWRPVGVEEYGYVAPDPLDPDIVYGGKVTRFDRRTGQVQNVAPEAAARRRATASCAPRRCCSRRSTREMLYFAGERALEDDRRRARAGRRSAPTSSRERPEVPASVGVYAHAAMATQPRRGVIYTVAPSLHGREHDLGRHRRRADPRHARRRQDLDERDAAGARRRGARCR